MIRIATAVISLISIVLMVGCGGEEPKQEVKKEVPVPLGFYDDIVNEDLSDMDRFVMLNDHISKRLKQEKTRDTTNSGEKEMLIVGTDAAGDTVEITRLDGMNLYLIEKKVFDECAALIFEGFGEDINNYHVFKRRTPMDNPSHCSRKNIMKKVVYAFDDVGTLINISNYDYDKISAARAAKKAKADAEHK